MGLEPDALIKGLKLKDKLARYIAFKEKWGVCPSEIVRIVLKPVGRNRDPSRPGHMSIKYHSVVWTRSGDEIFMPTNVKREIEGTFEERY